MVVVDSSKSELAASLLLSYIIDNNLKPGDKLPSEDEIAEKFGLSRVSVREGLRGLKFLGILKSTPRRGTVIQEMDFAILSRCLSFQIAAGAMSFYQLLDARLAIELGVLELICGRLNETQIAELRRAADCTRQDDSPEEVDRNYRQDSEFHRMLLEVGGNPILTTYSRMLEIFFLRKYAPAPSEACRRTTDEHMRLVDAIESGNLELARGIMRQHLKTYYSR